MKLRIWGVIFFCMVFAVPGAFAQGTIHVGNGIIGTRFPIYNAETTGGYVTGNSALSQPPGTNVYSGGLLSGTRYKIEFWAGPASAVDYSGLSLLTTMTFRTGANPAFLPNGITDTVSNMPVPGVLAGSQVKLGVRVWDTFSGATYSTAGLRGQGLLFLSAPLGGTPPVGVQILSPNWIGQSFAFPLPEPTSLALAGLGAATLLIFRRRK
ncbi:MAG: PEP-CTERM sorting domain-containing protein [Verrucomicrobiota bacterium]